MSMSYEPCQRDMYTLQSLHTTNIIDLLLIASDKLTKFEQ